MNLSLNQIRLIQFKNYQSANLAFGQGINVLAGPNGAGKTNILDAIYYLCLTKSFFNQPDSQIPLHGTDQFRLEGQFQRFDQSDQIVIKFQTRRKKILERNKITYEKRAEHIGQYPVVMIAPDDNNLALEGSEVRRKFLDNTLAQMDADYLQKLVLYNRLLSQRNALLKQFGKEQRFNASLLKTYDQKMEQPAHLIHEKRKTLTEALQPDFQELYSTLSNDQEAMSFSYESPLDHSNWIDLLDHNLEKDRIMQRTCSGIHRDNLVFKLDQRPLKRFASQGQLKSFVIAMKLAQYAQLKNHMELKPILLLDDLFDKLDLNRVESLVQLISSDAFGQVFISDTDPERMKSVLETSRKQSKSFYVKNGEVAEE